MARPLRSSTWMALPALEAFEQGTDVRLLHIPGDVLVACCKELPGGPATQLCVLEVKSGVGG